MSGAPRPIAGVILAAGSASRYRACDPSAATKVVAQLDGAPLVRHVAQAARAAGLSPIVVVTGHAAQDVRAALAGVEGLAFVHNPNHASGLASSLRTGVAALPADCPGAFILLGDMPRVGAPVLRALAQAFRAAPGACAATPVRAGERGNPALIGAQLFAEVAALSGDAGARKLLAARAGVIEVPVADEGVVIDVDTPQALQALARKL
jgi:molybdenum cofactor cytidylyltransferase